MHSVSILVRVSSYLQKLRLINGEGGGEMGHNRNHVHALDS